MQALLLLAAASLAPLEPAGTPRIEADRYGDDFGTVYRGEVLHSTFTLVNRGDADLEIQKLTNSCQCTASRFTIDGKAWEEAQLRDTRMLGVLSPGEEAVLEVVMRTAAATTPGDEKAISKAIRVYSNDPSRGVLSLTMSATMTSPFTVEPGLLDFGVVRKGMGAKCSAVIWSDALGEFPITGAKAPTPELLTVKATRVATEPGVPPTWRIDAELAPTTPMGSVLGHIELTVDHPRVKEIQVQVRYAVEPCVTFADNKPDQANLLDFEVMTAGTAKTVELVIENSDPRVPYLLRDVQLKDCRPTSEGFAAELVEVEKGMKYVVKVTAPAKLGKASYFTGSLVLNADHPDLPVRKVPFRGWYKSATKGAP